MRIRKRQAPFPLSSLSPVPISDPLINLNQPPSVVVQLHHYDPSQNDAVNPHPHGNPSQEPFRDTHVAPLPSDRPMNHHLSPIGTGNINRSTDGCDFSDADHRADDHKDTMNKKKKKEDRLELIFKEGEDNKGNDISMGSTPSAEADSMFHFPESTNSTSSPQGEKVFPLKKRRGSFLREEDQTSTLIVVDEDGHDHHKELHKKTTTNVKTVKAKATHKKECNSSRKNDDISNDHHQYDDQEEKEIQAHRHHQYQLGSNSSGKSNKKARGGAVVEGSRCSRVNGRGWRCCQQTLVGYSLCEHHLGKGRLRSMTSVRSRSMLARSSSPAAATAITAAQTGPLHEAEGEKETKLCDNVERIRDSIIFNEEDDDDDDDDGYDDDDDEDYGEHDYEKNKKKKKPLKIAKKRVKLGMVKARSISSLLGQTNSSISTGTGALSMADSKNKQV
ncbi:uncharacterized protein LOC133823434 isoform X2 [Humulus lupulus]|uniref:uncharacterized protein LOC133823434 isoform X2 n=1 Tax=Humulus lupulus TaxID=3486 RepID=UPI002B40150E|nr:uncharacterized protein LOC133823434 isoform X2 [Humulus lupulus]